MRIAHVLARGEAPWSGVFSVAVQAASALGRRGHEVQLWRMDEWTDAHHRRATAMLQSDVDVVAPSRPVTALRLTPAAARELESVHRPDIVHVHGAFNQFNAAFALSLRCRFALSPHGALHPEALRRHRLRKVVYRRLVEDRVLSRAAVVCALTAAEANQVHVDDPARVVVIPNGVERPPPAVDGRRFRHRFGLEEVRHLALYMGRLDVRHKGLDRIVPALVDAPDWHVVLVGPDQRGGRRLLEQAGADAGVMERMTFTGPLWQMDRHDAFAAADVLLLPSRWEGMPMVLLEALSHGVPALVTQPVEDAVPVAAAGAGWVSEPGRLGSTLRQVADLERGTRAARSAAARSLAAVHDWDVIAQQYEAAYELTIGPGATDSS